MACLEQDQEMIATCGLEHQGQGLALVAVVDQVRPGLEVTRRDRERREDSSVIEREDPTTGEVRDRRVIVAGTLL